MSSLDQALRAALDARQPLLAELHQQQTDCYRLFHGSQEGAAGLTVDRYGAQLMVQSFHQPLAQDALLDLHALINAQLGLDLQLVYNDRSGGNSRIDRRDPVYQATPEALEDGIGREWGLNYRVRGRHPGQDPLLFLDLREARGWVKRHSAGKRVLNLFAYTCGVGLCAAAGGARKVLNLDFAEGNLAVGRENLALNPGLAMDFVQSDYFPAIRQQACPSPLAAGTSCRATRAWSSSSSIWCCSTHRPGPRAPSAPSTCCATTRACSSRRSSPRPRMAC